MKYNDKTQIDAWIKTKNKIDLIEKLRTRPIHLNGSFAIKTQN